MTGRNSATRLLIVVAIIVTCAIATSDAAISDRRLCYDSKCSAAVSEAVTLMTYHSNDPGILSFETNVDVTVFSKSAGKRKDLWGVEINGQRGYVPWKMIKEKRVWRKTLIHEMPTEQVIRADKTTSLDKNVPKDNEEAAQAASVGSPSIPQPSEVSPSFEVHDGTTLPVAADEGPLEPSYSTATLASNPEEAEHPVLSVHPSITPVATSKNDEVTIDESIDVENYLKLAGQSEETRDEEHAEETSGKTDESVPIVDETKPIEAASANEPNDTSEKKILDELPPETGMENIDEATNKLSAVDGTETPKMDSEVKISRAEEQGDQKMPESTVDEHVPEHTLGKRNAVGDEGTETPEHRMTTTTPETPKELREEPTTPETTEHHEEPTMRETTEHREEPTTPETTEHREEPMTPETTEHHVEPMTPETPEKSHEEPTTPATPEQPREEEKTPDKSVENLDEKPSFKEEFEEKAPVTEPRSDPPDSSEINVDRVSSSAEIVSQQERALNEAKSDEKTTSTQDQSADSGIDGSENATLGTSGSSVVDNETLKEDSQSSESGPAAVEDSAHVPRENIEETSWKKSSEEVLPNVNILNPLFNRQSVLSTMSREEIADEGAGEPETTRSNEVDARTDVREDIDTEDADSSAKSDTAPGTIEPESIEHIDAEKIVNNVDSSSIDVDNRENKNDTTADNLAMSRDVATVNSVQPGIYKEDELSGFGQDIVVAEETSRFNGFPANRNLLNVGSGLQPDPHKLGADSSGFIKTENLSESKEESGKPETDNETPKHIDKPEIVTSPNDDSKLVPDTITEMADSCLIDSTCQKPEGLEENHSFVPETEDDIIEEEVDILDVISMGRNYWETLTYLVVTACTTLLFSLGYYYIENARRDGHYIAKINQLEKQLLVCSKECTVLDDTLKSTKTKLDSIEDESFGSNEMVASLKADLEASKTAKAELEDQVAMLEKELESATEAGLELERMLREILSTNNEDNPLAKSVEDLQTRLNAQQAANEALTNALNLKAQENENLTAELKTMSLKSEQLEVEVSRLSEELKQQHNLKSNLEQTLMEKVENLEKQVKDITAERINLRKQLKGKEMEVTDLLEVVNQMNTNNLDFEKLYDVSSIKAEASQLLEERDELKIRLSEVEGAHSLLEEHVKLINEEVSSLSEQCRLAEKAKRDAETRVEVLSNFFKEKETQRQKEEAIWLEKQGEVSSTVERLHAMQNEIHNYKQQIEMLKREILDQEREYKNQISALETKSHENWVVARQNERRLEESKVEASQLRNRLTLIEKNINDADPDVKLHRLEANGETPTSPQLFIGAEASSSPIMFAGSSGVPLPPPPSYLYGPHPVPPFMPPPLPPHSSSVITSPYEVGQRPPPLGGRLSSPPPLPTVNPSRYDDHRSPPPILQSFGPPHRGFPAFPNDRTHPPPPRSIPPPLGSGSSHTWGDEAFPPPPPPTSSLRNTGFQTQHQQHHRQPQHHHQHHHQQHRDGERRARNHKGSLHSSGESLDKNL